MVDLQTHSQTRLYVKRITKKLTSIFYTIRTNSTCSESHMSNESIYTVFPMYKTYYK